MDALLQAEQELFAAAQELGALNVLALITVVLALGAVVVLAIVVWKISAPLLKQNIAVFKQQAETQLKLSEAMQTISTVQARSNDVLENMTLTMTASTNSLAARISEIEDIFEASMQAVGQKVASERETGVRRVIEASDRRFTIIERGMGMLATDIKRIQERVDRLPDEALFDDIKRGVNDVTTRLQILINLNQLEARKYHDESSQSDAAGGAAAVPAGAAGAGAGSSAGGSPDG